MTRLRRYWYLVIPASIVFNVVAGPSIFAANVYLWGIVAQLWAARG